MGVENDQFGDERRAGEPYLEEHSSPAHFDPRPVLLCVVVTGGKELKKRYFSHLSFRQAFLC